MTASLDPYIKNKHEAAISCENAVSDSLFNNFSPTRGIHQEFPNTVQVCTAWVNSTTGNNIYPANCLSV